MFKVGDLVKIKIGCHPVRIMHGNKWFVGSYCVVDFYEKVAPFLIIEIVSEKYDIKITDFKDRYIFAFEEKALELI